MPGRDSMRRRPPTPPARAGSGWEVPPGGRFPAAGRQLSPNRSTEGQAPETVDLVTFAEAMSTLGDETRIRILRALRNQSLCVCDLAETVGVSQPLVSHHLKALKSAGLVSCRKEGPWVYYAVRLETFEALGLLALWEAGGVLASGDGAPQAAAAAPSDERAEPVPGGAPLPR